MGIDCASTEHSFDCDSSISRKFGILRNRLAEKLYVDVQFAKYIEIYERDVDNSMRRKSWTDTIDKGSILNGDWCCTIHAFLRQMIGYIDYDCIMDTTLIFHCIYDNKQRNLKLEVLITST
eukprot:TRINITY_DN9493_c0_g1_i1.p1 TRINITY_DN9493_c0_g1~~TRINITY_DN9493_c0_g1_i1.p1  ORF type:complete len:121 (-),score=12.20 TRINITY_DN9493_c0_g1_i1:97-459(-)